MGDDQRARADEHSNDDAADDDDVGTAHSAGSGSSDPELLTMKAARLIDEADVVLRDKLPGPEVPEMVPVEKREDVGKRAGDEWAPQEYTSTRLARLTREGKDVVRLKGDDPFVLGRGGERMEHLADNGVFFEVAPGITSAVAGASAADIPVTHHDRVSSASLVTDHEDLTRDESTIDWDALTTTGETPVILMGAGKLLLYTAELREAELAGDTPVALIERATWPNMRVTIGTLDTIVDVRDETDIEPPAITIIGEVVATCDRMKGLLQGGGADAIEIDAGANPTFGGAGGNE